MRGAHSIHDRIDPASFRDGMVMDAPGLILGGTRPRIRADRVWESGSNGAPCRVIATIRAKTTIGGPFLGARWDAGTELPWQSGHQVIVMNRG
jgi:hypothetical protein